MVVYDFTTEVERYRYNATMPLLYHAIMIPCFYSLVILNTHSVHYDVIITSRWDKPDQHIAEAVESRMRDIDQAAERSLRVRVPVFCL